MINTARHTREDSEPTIDRLSAASARRIIEPDTDLVGTVGSGQIIPDELLSIAGLDLDLTPEQRATLSREELASIITEGIRFESLLMAGMGMALAQSENLADTRVTYALHEMGEETRHSRMFVRLLQQIEPVAVSPFEHGIRGASKRWMLRHLIHYPALFCVLVLAGEEIPDLIQKRTSEHPDTDEFVRAVNKYHRQEESRHLAFARTVFPELWADSSFHQRWRVRHLAPVIIELMFSVLIHPGVYEAVGLPKWRTWRNAQRSAPMVKLRHDSTRPILASLIKDGALKAGHVPYAWRWLTGTDRKGQPVGAY
ncbi:MAG TPA: diiron oxygenase [Acidimicrobiales bacterium]|jgi:hypothetical protein|nr:diiron oxygenase [Acidimicrobiales bacterium]